MKTFNKSLKKYSLIAVSSLLLIACKQDDDVVEDIVILPTEFQATINMTQLVDDSTLKMNTVDLPYANEMNQKYNVSRLQYLISDITFNKANGSKFTLNEYHYVDLDIPSTLIFKPKTLIPKGDYTSISFTFGFDKSDNISLGYSELTTALWDWPTMLGGGYHFMRLEGDYITSNADTAAFAHHMGTAADNSTSPSTFVDNHFEAQLPNSAVSVTKNFSFDIEMNINEWYKNPTIWDLNVYNKPIMPIFAAQRLLNTNGPSVFTVKF